MKLEFKPEDLPCWCHEDDRVLGRGAICMCQTAMAGIVNMRLEKLLAKAAIVWISTDGDVEYIAKPDQQLPRMAVTHKARLVCIEKLEEEK